MAWVILDRDGVINYDSASFIREPQDFVPLPGSIAAIARLWQAGWQVAVATNQSGLARGLVEPASLAAIHESLYDAVREAGGAIDALAYCPHGPDAECSCRKPQPGLYERLAERLKASLHRVPVVGDSARDLEAAVAVGGRPMLVRTGKGEVTLERDQLPPGTEVYADLVAVAEQLLREAESCEPR